MKNQARKEKNSTVIRARKAALRRTQNQAKQTTKVSVGPKE